MPRMTTCPISPIISSMFIVASSKSLPYNTSGLSERFVGRLKSPLSNSFFRKPLWFMSSFCLNMLPFFSSKGAPSFVRLLGTSLSFLLLPSSLACTSSAALPDIALALISATCFAIFRSSSSLCLSPLLSL